MNIVLLDPAEIRSDGLAELSDARATHLLRVLRAHVGGTVRIGVIDGPLGVGTVSEVSEARVALTCALETSIPERPRVDLLLALPRPKVMRRLWAQLAALGVGQIILTNAEKVERDYFDTHVLQPEGYRPQLIEGLQQARDTRLPRVSIHKQFRKLVEDDLDSIVPSGRRLVAHPHPEAPGVRSALGDAPDRVLVAIGPEGGWNDFERGLLVERGFLPVSMGPRTLATTTACIAMLTLIHAALRPLP